MRGFKAEYFPVLTPKGYLLTVYHIINPLADPATLNRYPVLYGHGIFFDSMSMISRSEHAVPRKPLLGRPTINHFNISNNSDDHSLPFMLSNNNFDVWMFDGHGTNTLNTNWSVMIDPKESQQFWNFSLDDQSLYDLPFLMDFVLNKTGEQKLIYVGYSQSTLFMFALLSMRPEYSEKLVAFVALAPVTYISHIKGLALIVLAPQGYLAPGWLHYDFAPRPALDFVDKVLRWSCKTQALSNIFCKTLVRLTAGPGSSDYAPDMFSDFFKSTSMKVIKHFVQLYLNNRFSMYDYGPIINLLYYDQPHPPLYRLSNIKFDRIVLCRGLSDYLVRPKDQETLIKELGVKPYRDYVIPKYNHFDFVDGKDLIRLVNEPVVKSMYELMYKEGPNILKASRQTS